MTLMELQKFFFDETKEFSKEDAELILKIIFKEDRKKEAKILMDLYESESLKGVEDEKSIFKGVKRSLRKRNARRG